MENDFAEQISRANRLSARSRKEVRRESIKKYGGKLADKFVTALIAGAATGTVAVLKNKKTRQAIVKQAVDIWRM